MSTRLPSGWISKPIGELLAPLEDGRALHHGWSPQCEKEPVGTPGEEWGVLKTTAVQHGQFLPEHNKKLPSHLKPRPSLEVRAGDVLLTCAGPRARCGVACLVRHTPSRLILSGKMYRFRVREGVEPAYVEAYLQSPGAQAAIDTMKTGISDSGLNLTHARFKRLPVPVAPQPEQIRIVEEIDKQFTRLDAGVEALTRLQAHLRRYRAAVLSAAFGGGLVPNEAELSRASRRTYQSGADLLRAILVERRSRWERKHPGKAYAEPVAAEEQGLPSLPEGWCWATAEQLSDENRSITYGVIKLGDAVEGGIPTLRSSDVRHLRVDLDGVKLISPKIAAEYQRTFLNGGELLVTVRGTLGGIARATERCRGFNVSREVAVIALVDPRLGECAALFIGSPFLQAWLSRGAKGIAYTGVNIETLKLLPIPIPPLAEQIRISQEVERRLSVVDANDLAVRRALQRSKSLRAAILQSAFAGMRTSRAEA